MEVHLPFSCICLIFLSSPTCLWSLGTMMPYKHGHSVDVHLAVWHKTMMPYEHGHLVDVHLAVWHAKAT
jgi:hypothetical protein